MAEARDTNSRQMRTVAEDWNHRASSPGSADGSRVRHGEGAWHRACLRRPFRAPVCVGAGSGSFREPGPWPPSACRCGMIAIPQPCRGRLPTASCTIVRSASMSPSGVEGLNPEPLGHVEELWRFAAIGRVQNVMRPQYRGDPVGRKGAGRTGKPGSSSSCKCGRTLRGCRCQSCLVNIDNERRVVGQPTGTVVAAGVVVVPAASHMLGEPLSGESVIKAVSAFGFRRAPCELPCLRTVLPSPQIRPSGSLQRGELVRTDQGLSIFVNEVQTGVQVADQ